jgi:hypothetical protein
LAAILSEAEGAGRKREDQSPIWRHGASCPNILCDRNGNGIVTVLGIPETMDAEYLRLVGTLMRVFRSEKLRRRLQQAEKPSQIVDIFEQGESALHP